MTLSELGERLDDAVAAIERIAEALEHAASALNDIERHVRPSDKGDDRKQS